MFGGLARRVWIFFKVLIGVESAERYLSVKEISDAKKSEDEWDIVDDRSIGII